MSDDVLFLIYAVFYGFVRDIINVFVILLVLLSKLFLYLHHCYYHYSAVGVEVSWERV